MNTPSTPPSANTEAAGDATLWTEQRIRALGAVTDLPTAGRIFGLGRSLAYALAQAGEFPAPVIRVATRYRVPTAGILTALGINPGSGDLTTAPHPSVDDHDEIRTNDAPAPAAHHQGEP